MSGRSPGEAYHVDSPVDKELLLVYIDTLRTQVDKTEKYLAQDDVDRVFLWLKRIEANAVFAARNIPAAAVSPEAMEEAGKLDASRYTTARGLALG